MPFSQFSPLNEVARFHKANRNNSPGVHRECYIYIFVFNNMISGHSKGTLLMQYKLITVAHSEIPPNDYNKCAGGEKKKKKVPRSACQI